MWICRECYWCTGDRTYKCHNIYYHEASRPERSKREDFDNKCICDNCPWVHMNHSGFPCVDPNTNKGKCKTKMRCSEHCGNTVREAK